MTYIEWKMLDRTFDPDLRRPDHLKEYNELRWRCVGQNRRRVDKNIFIDPDGSIWYTSRCCVLISGRCVLLNPVFPDRHLVDKTSSEELPQYLDLAKEKQLVCIMREIRTTVRT